VAKARRSAARKRNPGNRGRLEGEAIHGVRSHSPIRSKSDHRVPVEALVRLGPELSAPGWSEHHY